MTYLDPDPSYDYWQFEAKQVFLTFPYFLMSLKKCLETSVSFQSQCRITMPNAVALNSRVIYYNYVLTWVYLGLHILICGSRHVRPVCSSFLSHRFPCLNHPPLPKPTRNQCCGSVIRDLEPFLTPEPGSGVGFSSRSGIPNHIFESLMTIFFFG